MGRIPNIGFGALIGLEPGDYIVSVGNDDTITVSRNARPQSRRTNVNVDYIEV